MDKQVKMNHPRLYVPVPFIYTGNSIYHRGSCGKILSGGERAGEKILDCTVTIDLEVLWNPCEGSIIKQEKVHILLFYYKIKIDIFILSEKE